MRLRGLAALSTLSLLMPVPAAFGASVSAFSLNWANGPATNSLYKSEDHPGSVFVLEAFQTNCAPCNQNVPNVDALVEARSSDSRVQILDLGINTNPRSLAEWINRHSPNHPVVVASDTLRRELALSVTPTAYVVDCSLQITWRHEGVWSADVKNELNAAIDEALSSCE